MVFVICELLSHPRDEFHLTEFVFCNNLLVVIESSLNNKENNGKCILETNKKYEEYLSEEENKLGMIYVKLRTNWAEADLYLQIWDYKLLKKLVIRLTQ